MPFHESANILYFLKDILKVGDIVRIVPTFEEIYMHMLIENCLEMKGLVLSDKPDLIAPDYSVGIEIVSAEPEYSHKYYSLSEKQRNRDLKEREKAALYNTAAEEFSIKDESDNQEYIKLVQERIYTKIGKKLGYRRTVQFGIAIQTDYVGDINNAVKVYQEILQNVQKDVDFLILNIINNTTIVLIQKNDIQLVEYAEEQRKLRNLANQKVNALYNRRE